MQQISKLSEVGPVYAALLKIAQTDTQPPELDQEQKGEDPLVYRIPEWSMGYLTEKIEKLNKICTKLQIPPITVQILGEEKKQIQSQNDTPGAPAREIVLKLVRIDGHAPKLNGWTLAARILHTEEGNVIKATPDIGSIPPEYRTSKPFCEHCKTNRDRRDTFLVKNDATGEIKQIGRNCLKDFLGHQSPELYARFAENLSDLYSEAGALEEESDGGGGSSGGARSVSVESYLQAVLALSHVFGYTSRTKAKAQAEMGKSVESTADTAFAYCTNFKDADEIKETIRKLGKKLEVTDADKELVTKALDWARKLKEGSESNEALSDYLWNLAVACSSSVVNGKTAGIVASLPSAYQRANSNADTGTATTAGKGYVGTVGRPILIKGTILFSKSGQSFKGPYTLFKLQDDQQNVITWFDNSGTNAAQQGDQLAISGVVKAQSMYQGKPQTELAGVKVLSEEEYQRMKAEAAVADEAAEKAKATGQPAPEAPPLKAGDKVQLTLLVTDKKEIQGQGFSRYDTGKRNLYLFTDDFGRKFKWFTTSDELEIGQKYTVKATIKGEDEYNGQKQFQLLRVEVLAVGDQAAVTTKDISAKRSALKKVEKKVKTFQEQLQPLQDQLSTVLQDQDRTIAVPVIAPRLDVGYASPADIIKDIQTRDGEFTKTISEIQQTIADARQQVSNEGFKPKITGWLPHGARAHLVDTTRSITPQEFLTTVVDAVKQVEEVSLGGQSFLTQLKEVQNKKQELSNQGANYYTPAYRTLEQQEYQIKEHLSQICESHKSKLFDYTGRVEEALTKLPQMQQDIQRAQQAVAQQQTDFKPTEGVWPYSLQQIVPHQLNTQEYIKRAEDVVQASMALYQQTQPILQQIMQMLNAFVPTYQEWQQGMKELSNLQDQKGKAKAMSEWILKTCKFALALK